jgi:multidrug efflux system outer membrane protein
MKPLSVLAVVSTLITGCAIGPDYVRPQLDVPPSWRIDYSAAVEVVNTRWWEAFGDPVLNDLIDTSLRGNLDVRIAAARIDQFIGSLRSTRAQLFPQIGYSVDTSRLRASRSSAQALPPGVDNYFTLTRHPRRGVADRPLRASAAAQRSGAGPGLRKRAGAARRRIDARGERRVELHRVARA